MLVGCVVCLLCIVIIFMMYIVFMDDFSCGFVIYCVSWFEVLFDLLFMLFDSVLLVYVLVL